MVGSSLATGIGELSNRGCKSERLSPTARVLNSQFIILLQIKILEEISYVSLYWSSLEAVPSFGA